MIVANHLQELECPRCHKPFKQNSYSQKHCVVCAYEVANEKRTAAARAKRARLKAQKEAQNHAG